MRKRTLLKIMQCCVCIIVIIITALVVFGPIALVYKKVNAQEPIRQISTLTSQEASCEKITPRNQIQCAGPETRQKLENCEQYYDVALSFAKQSKPGSLNYALTADVYRNYALASIAYSNVYQNCLARNKR